MPSVASALEAFGAHQRLHEKDKSMLESSPFKSIPTGWLVTCGACSLPVGFFHVPSVLRCSNPHGAVGSCALVEPCQLKRWEPRMEWDFYQPRSLLFPIILMSCNIAYCVSKCLRPKQSKHIGQLEVNASELGRPRHYTLLQSYGPVTQDCSGQYLTYSWRLRANVGGLLGCYETFVYT